MKFAAYCLCALLKSCSVRCGLVVLLALACSSAATAQTILYVDDDAPAGGNGTSWSTAFQNPQSALDQAAASAGQAFSIHVAQGRYLPSKRTIADDPRSASFTLPANVSLQGGYAGLIGTDPDASDIDAFVTTLSGDLNGDDGPEFANNSENCYHIIFNDDTGPGAVLDGVTISGGNANTIPSDEPELHRHRGGGVLNVRSSPHITRCTFTSNYARSGSGIHNRIDSSPQIDHCRFIDNDGFSGTGVFSYDGSNPSINGCEFVRNSCDSGVVYFSDDSYGPSFILCDVSGCLFQDNRSNGVSAGIAMNHAFKANIADCAFIGNSASIGAGALQLTPLSTATNCRFERNSSGVLGGAVVADTGSRLENCEFIDNHCDWLGGAVNSNLDNTFINCIFSRNSAEFGGGVAVVHGSTFINCTISNNTGGGVNWVANDAVLKIKNCIIWGNSGSEIAFVEIGVPPIPDNGGSGTAGSVVVKYSNIRGGWTGAGHHNIDLPPLFVQPGCDNFRLAYGSPCSDAGRNSPVINTPTDLDGLQRIQNGLVDLGAYESGHDPMPWTACADDLDVGEYMHLVPAMGVAIPAGRTSVDVTNIKGSDNAFVRATESPDNPHVGSLGFGSIAATLQVETDLANGQSFMFVRVPFDEASLNGADPMTADLVYFDSALNRWFPAVEANTQNSPDHAGPIGDRFTESGSTYPAISTDLGDYGVFWNTTTRRGYVWANLDHASEFAAGLPLSLCPADCASPPNGQVNLPDLVSVLTAWGQTAPAAGAQDVNRNGVVDIDDLVAVISAWGACP